MKKYLLIIILSITTNLIAQRQLPIDSISGKIVFKTIIELDSTYNSKKIYELAREWFSTNPKMFSKSNGDRNNDAGEMLLGIERSNSTSIDQLHKNSEPLKLQDPENKKLIGKGLLKYTGSSLGCIRILYFDYDLKISIKDSRLKLEITNFNYTHYNQITMKQVQIYGWNDNGLCNSQNSIESLLKCERCKNEFEKLYNYLVVDMKKTSENLTKFLKDNKLKDEEKW